MNLMLSNQITLKHLGISLPNLKVFIDPSDYMILIPFEFQSQLLNHNHDLFFFSYIYLEDMPLDNPCIFKYNIRFYYIFCYIYTSKNNALTFRDLCNFTVKMHFLNPESFEGGTKGCQISIEGIMQCWNIRKCSIDGILVKLIICRSFSF